MKNIAVLAYDSKAFQHEVRSMFAATINTSTRTAITFPDVTFRFIGSPEQCRGYTFDAVILFEGYTARERWRETFESLKYCMRG
jgi:hypothetical protein